MQYLQSLRLITVNMVGPDAQHEIDWGSLARRCSLDEADPVVEASCTGVPPGALEHRAVGVEADTFGSIAHAQDPKKKFRPSTSDVQHGTGVRHGKCCGDRVRPSARQRSIEVEELVISRRWYVTCHAGNLMSQAAR